MNFYEILPVIAPVAFIIIVGAIVGRTLDLDRRTLSQLILYILSPALIGGSLYNSDLSAASATGLVVGYVITTLLVYLVTKILAVTLRLDHSSKTSLIATSLFPNNGNMGLPIVTLAFGEAGLERAIIYMICSAILMYSAGPALIQGKGLRQGLGLTVRLPLIWAIAVGLSLRLVTTELPLGLNTAVEQLGQAAIPVMLIILGIQLISTPFQLGRREIIAGCIRLGLAPAIAAGVGITMGLTGLDLQVLILQSAMPTAVSSVVLVTEFGGDAALVARCVVVSTLASFATLSGVLLLL